MEQALNIFKDILSIGVIASILTTILTRILPNSKVYSVGWSIGAFLTKIGSARFGQTMFNKIEDFLENSIRQLSVGFIDGLESDEGVAKKDIPSIKPVDVVKK